jgi:hypothetical protein
VGSRCACHRSPKSSSNATKRAAKLREDFFNAEDAKVGAEFRRESFSSVTLDTDLSDLGVESGGHLFGCGFAVLCLSV